MSFHARTSRNTRRRVKLGNLHHADGNPSGNGTLFWYSYESALTWVRNHESIISKCVQFLQIYPNLIQDSSMDTFWDFIEALMHGENSNKTNGKHNGSITHKRDAQRLPKHKEKECSARGPEIPHISVTESAVSASPTFTISAQHARTPRVHLISRSKVGSSFEDDKRLHLGVIDMLQDDFYIRVTNWTHQSSLDFSKESHRQYIVAESDVCVFLFNDTTLEDPACFHDLCTALVQRIPIVYVRYHQTQLPKTFSETIIKNSKGCITLKDYTEKFMSPSRPVSSCATLSVKNSRNKKKLAPLIVGNRSRSTSDLYVKNNDAFHKKNQRVSQNLETDLVLTLLSNFKNACIFDEGDLQACSSRLKQEIYYVLGIGKSKTESENNYSSNGGEHSMKINNAINNFKYNDLGDDYSKPRTSGRSFLSVPDPEDVALTREWGSFGSNDATTDKQRDTDSDLDGCEDDSLLFNNDSRMVVSPSPDNRATTYLIFDQNKALAGPRKVAFPAEDDSASEAESVDLNVPSDSPISFHEIDLSREINPRGTPESDASSIF